MNPASLPSEHDVVGNYKLIKLLGTGGMGTVFLAEHRQIGRKVAIKFLLPELSRYPDIVGRFFDEARSVNRINHENIVEVFDFVTSASLSYLVMELLEGTDLYQTRKREGPYPLARTLFICEQIASALAGAHKVGIVHRDLKPENAFLIKKRGNRDFVKLLDFGLAKLSEDLPVARQPTQAGIVMGTPGYMSPEQAHGTKIDGRADVFSLGVLLHWMLVDRVPDGGPDSEAPGVNVAGEEVPDQLRALVARCIRLKADERPHDMAEVAELLTDLRRQVRGTEVLQILRPPSQGEQPQPARDRTSPTEPTLPVYVPPGRAPLKQLLLAGASAALATLLIVGVIWAVLGRGHAPAKGREAVREHPGPAQAVAAPTTDFPHLPPPPEAAAVPPPGAGAGLDLTNQGDGDVLTPRGHGHPKRAKHHPAPAR